MTGIEVARRIRLKGQGMNLLEIPGSVTFTLCGTRCRIERTEKGEDKYSYHSLGWHYVTFDDLIEQVHRFQL